MTYHRICVVSYTCHVFVFVLLRFSSCIQKENNGGVPIFNLLLKPLSLLECIYQIYQASITFFVTIHLFVRFDMLFLKCPGNR